MDTSCHVMLREPRVLTKAANRGGHRCMLSHWRLHSYRKQKRNQTYNIIEASQSQFSFSDEVDREEYKHSDEFIGDRDNKYNADINPAQSYLCHKVPMV